MLLLIFGGLTCWVSGGLGVRIDGFLVVFRAFSVGGSDLGVLLGGGGFGFCVSRWVWDLVWSGLLVSCASVCWFGGRVGLVFVCVV